MKSQYSSRSFSSFLTSPNASTTVRFLTAPFAALVTLLLLNSCSILIGSVKPVEERAPESAFLEVQNIDPSWKKIELKNASDQVSNAGEIPDASWQSTKTAAIISLNSACREESDPYAKSDAREVTETILAPWRKLAVEHQREITASGFTGLETTAQGIYLNRARKFRLVVVKASSCTYDLLYLSPVSTFLEELSVFERFRASLKLK